MVKEEPEPLEKIGHVRSLEVLSKTFKRLYMRPNLKQLDDGWGFWLGHPEAEMLVGLFVLPNPINP